MTLSEELNWRGFVNQTTYPDITALDGETLTFYLGVDPSADSMTVGNLAVVMMVGHFIRHGHKAILLVGGATGMIGDPDGKKQERDLLTLEQIEYNKSAIGDEYKKVLGEQSFELVDNYDWFKDMGYLEFLRDVGKHVPMRQMLSRDFVQSRLGEDGSGISYAEFSYSLIQGYDFVHLHKEKGVTLQICGADQWGNSITGVDLIRRLTGNEAHVWSAPLVVNKTTGVKFGKSEAGAIWLNPNKTRPFEFYQFWLNLDDDGVEEYLKIYTLLTKEEIDAVMTEFVSNRAGRAAQKRLADEVTRIVHGQETLNNVKQATAALFVVDALDDVSLGAIKAVVASQPLAAEMPLLEAIVKLNLASSNNEARRFVAEGAISINGVVVTTDKQSLSTNDWRNDLVVVKRGKNAVAIGRKQ